MYEPKEKEPNKPIIWSISPNNPKQKPMFIQTLQHMKEGGWFIRETSYTGVLSVVKKKGNAYKETFFTLAPDLIAEKGGALVPNLDDKGHHKWVWKETEPKDLKPYLKAHYTHDTTEIQDGAEKLSVKDDLIQGRTAQFRDGSMKEDRTVRHTGVMFQLAGQSATDSLFAALKRKGYEGEPVPAPQGYQAIGCKSAVTLEKYKSYEPYQMAHTHEIAHFKEGIRSAKGSELEKEPEKKEQTSSNAPH